MSDFGAGACDFHSDFASNFCTEGSDYASDFCDFPGDSDSDFGSEARHSGHRTAWRAPTRQPQRPRRRRSTAAADRKPPEGHKGDCKLSAQAASHGAGGSATPQGQNKTYSARIEYGI